VVQPVGAITQMGMHVLGVFLGLLYGWIFIDLLWTSLLGFIALGLTGFMTINEAFSAGLGNSSVIMVIVCAAMAEVLSQIGVNQVIAYWLLSRKVFIGRSWLLVIGLIIAALVMGMSGGGFAAVYLLWSVVGTMAELNGLKKTHPLVSMLSIILLYGVFTGVNIVPFKIGIIAYGGFLTQATGIAIPSAPTFILGLIFAVATLLLLVAVMKFVLKIDASKFNITAELCEEYGRLTVNKYQKASLILLVCYFAGLLLPEIFPEVAFMQFLKQLGITGFAIIYMVIFVIWRDETGKPVADVFKAFRNTPWPVVILFAVTFPLSSAMQSADVGIMATAAGILKPMLTSLGVTPLIIITLVVLGILTQFMHNVILGAIFIPLLCPLFAEMGGNPLTLWFAIYILLQSAYATPAGSMMAGVVFGNEDIPKKDAYFMGWLFVAVSVIVLICMVPLCNMLF